MQPYITTPSGICPVILEHTDDVSIVKWAKKTRDARLDGQLTNDALKYWVQHSFPIFSSEWKHVRERIDVVVKDIKRPKHSEGK